VPRPLADLRGQRFARLTVVRNVPHKPGHHTYWLCRCDCGGKTITEASNLRRGLTRSCGCLQRELQAAARTTHGLSTRPEYFIWQSAKARCYNVNSHAYWTYGGRGITMCDRWRTSFEHFYADMGPRPSRRHSVERRDNAQGYSPENCYWATAIQQYNNRRSNRRITWRGETHTTTEWSRLLGFPPQTVKDRINRRNWTVERALTQPLNIRSTVLTLHGERRTLQDWARRLGVSRHTIHARLRAGWTVERALTHPLRRQRKPR